MCPIAVAISDVRRAVYPKQNMCLTHQEILIQDNPPHIHSPGLGSNNHPAVKYLMHSTSNSNSSTSNVSSPKLTNLNLDDLDDLWVEVLSMPDPFQPDLTTLMIDVFITLYSIRRAAGSAEVAGCASGGGTDSGSLFD